VARTQYFVHFDGLADTLDLRGPQIAEREISLYEPARLLGDDDTAGWRDRLHPGSEIRHMSHWRIFSVAASIHDPQHHFARIDPDSSFNRHRLQLTFLAGKLLAMFSQPLLDSECRVKRTLRMVLMGNRRTKHRENSVTGGLRDVAIVSVNRVHHQLQYRVNDCTRLLGIELSHQLGRALNIGE
jgi:hypothetical protein